MRSTTVPLLLGACLALASPAAHGAELPAPQLLADLVPGVAPLPLQWEPVPLLSAGGRMLFSIELPEGSQLWSSDGTKLGAERLLGGNGSTNYFAWEQAGAVVVLEDAGNRVWRTDGTAAGTVLVASWPDAGCLGWFGQSPRRGWFAPCYYEDDGDRCELWMLDGAAPAATRLAEDFELYDVEIEQLAVGDRMFFFAGEQGGELQLWRSEGTAETTGPIARWPAGNWAFWLGRSGRRVFFEVDPPHGGTQVWTSDGTSEGTRAIVQLPTDTYSPWAWIDRGEGPFFYTAYDAAVDARGLWALGPAGKARRLGSFAAIEGPIQRIGTGPAARYLFAAARRPPAFGEQPRLRLWVTDGTPGGTMELRGIAGGPVQVESLWGVVADRLYFAGNDGSTGVEPWTSDGTAAGTRRIADTCPGPCGSQSTGVAALGPAALFVSGGGGEQTLWRSDGASASPVASLDGVSANLGYDGRAPVAGGRLFFGVSRGGGFELWASDGTAAGTGRVDPGFTTPLGSAPVPLAVSAQSLLFTAVDPLDDERRRLYLQRRGEALGSGVRLPEYVYPTTGVLDDARGRALFVASGSQLWVTDGTAGGTVQLTAFGASFRAGDKYHDDCDNVVELPQRSGGRWYFVADVCFEGEQLWSTDGTIEGTRRAGVLPQNAASAALLGDVVFFLAPVEAGDGTDELQLFRTTLAGGEAVQLTRRAGGFHDYFRVLPVGSALGRVFFTLANASESELWVSDGTPAGTGLIVVAPGGAPLANVERVAAGNGFAIAWTRDPESGEGRVFGIAPASRIATWLAAPRVPDPYYVPVEWASSAAGVLFAGYDLQHGYEPWISDGTPAGTRVLDLAPGSASTDPHGFTASDAGVFFSARVFESGEELWVADAAANGVRLVADLAAGRDSSSPNGLVAGPGRLLFVADDGASGREPWVLEWAAASPGAGATGGTR